MTRKKKLENPITINPIKINQDTRDYCYYQDVDMSSLLITEILYSIEEHHILPSIKLKIFFNDRYDDFHQFGAYYQIKLIDTNDRKNTNNSYELNVEQYNVEGVYKNKYEEEKLYLYFSSIGIEYTPLAEYILIIMHEIGHLYNYYIFDKDLIFYYQIDQVFKSLGDLYRTQSQVNMSDQMLYEQTWSEANADVFAYKNFPLVWNSLKMKGLV